MLAHLVGDHPAEIRIREDFGCIEGVLAGDEEDRAGGATGPHPRQDPQSAEHGLVVRGGDDRGRHYDAVAVPARAARNRADDLIDVVRAVLQEAVVVDGTALPAFLLGVPQEVEAVGVVAEEIVAAARLERRVAGRLGGRDRTIDDEGFGVSRLQERYDQAKAKPAGPKMNMKHLPTQAEDCRKKAKCRSGNPQHAWQSRFGMSNKTCILGLPKMIGMKN
ncbi:hypothetical protein [Belnapia moabensis]|uniref:hypothetical protein n=1 Tax=Belnapia moabensis TaxID=365533 RepID=UPI0012EDF622|nr:hypothetical protein [Belnapia moabensis]